MTTDLKKSLSMLGVPLGYGASMAGVDIGPAALRVARITQRIAHLGYSVHDLGDMRLERPQTFPEADEKLKYVREISNACEQLAAAPAKLRLLRERPATSPPSRCAIKPSLCNPVPTWQAMPD